MKYQHFNQILFYFHLVLRLYAILTNYPSKKNVFFSKMQFVDLVYFETKVFICQKMKTKILGEQTFWLVRDSV